MNKIWLELKYGNGKTAITIHRLKDTQLLQDFKRKALKQAQYTTQESIIIDEVIGTMDRFELEKLKRVLDLLIPSDKD